MYDLVFELVFLCSVFVHLATKFWIESILVCVYIASIISFAYLLNYS